MGGVRTFGVFGHSMNVFGHSMNVFGHSAYSTMDYMCMSRWRFEALRTV